MISSKALGKILIVVLAVGCMAGCAKDDNHWGQELRVDKSWWKKEGQSWDRKTNIFMTIGHSNPDWTDKYDMRKSADLDARAQIAAFMDTLVTNYMQEIRSRHFSISESVVDSYAEQTVMGSVVVARKYKKKRYMSLIQIDLNYFFAKVYGMYGNELTRKLKKENPRKKGETALNAEIQDLVVKALESLKAAEVPTIEETIREEEARQ